MYLETGEEKVEHMKRPENGFDFLTQLRAKNGKARSDFSSLEDYLELKAREQGVPLHGQFELTPLCNMDCKMCYVHLAQDQMEGHSIMSVPQWKQLMYDAWEMGMYNVTLSGGECLAYPGFEELYLYLLDLGCKVSILTNGVLLDERWCRFFQEHRPVGIRITLYGNSEDAYERVTGHRVFERVRDNIRRVIDARLPLSITVTPNRFLGEDVLDTVRMAKSLWREVHVASALFEPREETGRSGVEYGVGLETYLKIYQLINEIDGVETAEIEEKDLPAAGGACTESSGRCGLLCAAGRSGLLCAAGRSAFVVDWKGTMRPCNRLQDIRSYPLVNGFREAWKAINQIACEWPQVPECEGCAYKSVCSRCAATMLQYVEPGRQPVEMCERVRYLVRHGVWHVPECE